MTSRRAAGIALVSFLLAAAFALGLFLTARSRSIIPPTIGQASARESQPRAIEEVREALA
jgi:hypothetical protein